MFRSRAFLRVPVFISLVVGIALGLFACGGGGGGESPPVTSVKVAFPLVVSADKRYLRDQNNVPFPILGRTAWFITSLSVVDYKIFIDDTVAKGYNAIEFHVINHDPRGNNPPFGNNPLIGNGDLPFLQRLDGSNWSGTLFPNYSNINIEAPNLTTPNPVYWSFVDELLAYCESKGVLVFMFPAYVGFGGTDQGWMNEMVANGTMRMQDYGEWIATRYMNQKNIVWMLGGDYGYDPDPLPPDYNFTAAELAVELAMRTGMTSVGGQQSIHFSAEWRRGSIATDQPDLASQMTLNGTYANSADINNQGNRAYLRVPTIPAFLLEQPYDEEGPDGNGVNADATQPVRRFQWWGVLSTIGGYISGNGYVWPFNSLPLGDNWKLHLNTQGAQDMARLHTFVRSIAWYNLVPAGSRVTGNAPIDSSAYVAAAATPDGTLLVAYVPPDHNTGSITVNMTGMSGPTRARWFDPTTTDVTVDASSPLPAGTSSHVFTPPAGNHLDGFDDWILILEKQ